ncbi:selenium-binding protein SBP56-related protein [Methylomonas sp. MgM2]
MNTLIKFCSIASFLICFSASDSFANDAKKNAPPNTEEKYLFVWAGDQEHDDPDFLAVINFDSKSDDYGKVITTVPLPPPGETHNEPHHCHLSKDKNILACGGLLSLLKNQDSIFFFDVSNPEMPVFLSSTKAALSDITDDFLPLDSGGFLITNMGSESGFTPGRLVELDARQGIVNEWPILTPSDDASTLDDFNPHGISARPEVNLMVTSDFLEPASTLNDVPGESVLRSSVRVWNFQKRRITRTIPIVSPTSGSAGVGTMDIKLIPGDPHKRAFTAGMFDGWIYLVDTVKGKATPVFDCEDIVPHVEVEVRGGMIQLLDITKSGKSRLLTGAFQAGQVIMLDVSDPENPKQAAVVDLGKGAGPHSLYLSADDKRLVVTDYFLEEEDFGKIHFEGDHKVHVIQVDENNLQLDPRFTLDFNTAFSTGPARPHGFAMK